MLRLHRLKQNRFQLEIVDFSKLMAIENADELMIEKLQPFKRILVKKATDLKIH